MKSIFKIMILITLGLVQTTAIARDRPGNRLISDTTKGLRQNPYIELSLGEIKPKGWLLEMLKRQKSGLTGQLDVLYPEVMGERNGWLGGDGDQWERGPYWIDGLLPLAYILEDKELIEKTKPWVEWAIKSQKADGYFGPSQDYDEETGLQRNNSRDWWPKMVMLKVLKQYYSATKDKRVIKLLTNYFKYQLEHLPSTRLDNWTFWARYRGAENLMVVYWLYNITKDEFLLDLGEIIHKQTFDYTTAFNEREMLTTEGSIHCVNLAQGIKAPLVYYQRHPEEKYRKSVETALADIRKFHGMAHGMFGGDEALHGNNPTQGSEFCSAVEMMFSMETVLQITGENKYADQIEKIAFNALPAQATDDFMNRQYFQQANQVMVSNQIRNFQTNHDGTDNCYGLLTGFPCCTANMHQGWPKFAQNLWYSTADHGIAALLYSPNEVNTTVAGNIAVKIVEETNYPFQEDINFTFHFEKGVKNSEFPFHLRIPSWCQSAEIRINGLPVSFSQKDGIAILKRKWNSNDVVQLHLPMNLYQEKWDENSISIQRGPLTFALKMGEKMELVQNDNPPGSYGGKEFYEIHPTTPWNYGLVQEHRKFEDNFIVEFNDPGVNYPWNLENAPIRIKTKAKRIPSWQLYNGMAGPLPYSGTYRMQAAKNTEEITLVPYGCTQLRISQFPRLD
ncbi:hypothetical protein SMI01S_28480 [Sphingobacterium mizutaii NBRC 14946 = DSM 11724]|uniref:Uncharacterized protein conserved in bacteria n=3 Tax=Sphingobacterium mizutaii TaxID=1010 RepID=A0AAJ4XCJ1_9SPHI|nr:hypothetical protein SMI01S_28480 [Sphingobacterium mizutaii NBRC 14946 = DSM 11724]SDL10765.1 DUF1680 family protein [Sphingobacterium mizutaii]SNV51535.1 Uncharacterized protein conserved in bacteria [Sphingobacterium mizutaii]